MKEMKKMRGWTESHGHDFSDCIGYAGRRSEAQVVMILSEIADMLANQGSGWTSFPERIKGMQDAVMDESRVWPVRPAAFRPWSMITGFAFLISAQAGDAHAQESLRWKLSAGEVLKYSISQKMVMSVKSMGRERKQTRTQTIDYSWHVKEAAPSGDAQVTLRIDHVTMKVEAPPYIPFEFDSNNPKADVPEPFELEVQQLKASVGAEFSFTMKPTGEIVDLTIAPATLKKLRDAVPPELAGARCVYRTGTQRCTVAVEPSSVPKYPSGARQDLVRQTCEARRAATGDRAFPRRPSRTRGRTLRIRGS